MMTHYKLLWTCQLPRVSENMKFPVTLATTPRVATDAQKVSEKCSLYSSGHIHLGHSKLTPRRRGTLTY